MRKFLFTVVAMMATITVSAQLTANPTTLVIKTGVAKDVVFSLATEVEITLYEFYVQCPTGIEIPTRINEDEEEELSIDMVGSRHKSTHSITSGEVEGKKGLYLISVGSNKNATLKELSGEVLKVTFKATGEIGKDPIVIKDAIAGTPDENQIQLPGFNISIDPTAINSIKAEETKNGVIYNVSGQRVSKATKGVYVIDGKKYTVK